MEKYSVEEIRLAIDIIIGDDGGSSKQVIEVLAYRKGHKTIWTTNSPLTLEGHKYQCYIDNTQEAFPKTFDEWLNS